MEIPKRVAEFFRILHITTTTNAWLMGYEFAAGIYCLRIRQGFKEFGVI